jgi:enoyl-CoA hydratase/carnithine racemase
MVDYSRLANANLLVTVQDKIATVTINRPERMNSITTELHSALEDVFVMLNQDDRVRCVILTGAGNRAFCAGADVKGMASRNENPAEAKPLGNILRNAKWLIHNFLNLEVPIIGAINGDAVGLGSTLALMCDITVMSETARIGDTHVKIGLVAGDGGALMWPFLIGMNRSKELLMTGRLIKGPEAERIGLVNYSVPADQVMAKSIELATELANGAPMAVRWTKSSLNQHIWQQVVTTHHFALGVESLTAASEDTKEAAKAFVEKRTPTFKNR